VKARPPWLMPSHNLQDPSKLTPTYTFLSRIRLSSSFNVLVSAEQVVQHIINTYSQPNLAAEESQSRAARRQDALREFRTSAVLNLKRCKTNSDRVPSAESRAHFTFLGSWFCSKLMSVGVSTRSTLIQHS
jgi:hypothetical protein